MQCSGIVLKHASSILGDNDDIVKSAVQCNGRALEHASQRLRDNEDIVKFAALCGREALQYARKRLRQTWPSDQQRNNKHGRIQPGDRRKHRWSSSPIQSGRSGRTGCTNLGWSSARSCYQSSYRPAGGEPTMPWMYIYTRNSPTWRQETDDKQSSCIDKCYIGAIHQ